MCDIKTKRVEAVDTIVERSTLLLQMDYNKRTHTSYELRCKDGKTFILMVKGDGSEGFDIYYPEASDDVTETKINFLEYGTIQPAATDKRAREL